MTRPYRLSLPETCRVVDLGPDEACLQLDLLEILPADEMRGLLWAELQGGGFVAAGTALVQREPGLEVEITVDGYRVAALLRAVEAPAEAAPQRAGWQGRVSTLQAALVQAECRVAAAALKCKAARLGSIKRLIDDPQTGSLSIVIEI